MLKYERIDYDLNVPIKLKAIKFQGPYDIPDNHWHRSLEILKPVNGNLQVWVNGKDYIISKNELIIIGSKSIHKVLLEDPYGYYEGYVLQINYNFLMEIETDIEKYDFTLKTQDKSIMKIYNDLINDCKIDNNYKNLLIEGSLIKLVFYLLQYGHLKDKKDNISDKYRERMACIVNYLDKNYQSDLTIESVAANFNLSAGYFSKLFKDNFDLTIKEYLMAVRMKRAYHDLVYTDLPIVDVALNNGFPNLNSFYKMFKDKYHMTPLAYRKYMRK